MSAQRASNVSPQAVTNMAAQGATSMTMNEAKSEKKFLAEWRLRLAGADSADEQSQAKLVDIRAEIKAKYLLSKSLYLDLQPSLRLQSGTTQFVDGADKAENKISLNQAAVLYRPVSAFRIAAGALNQRHMHTAILIDPIAFPAARAEGLLALDNLNFRSVLAIESAIPTSTSLSTNTKELEPTPSLNTASLKMNWQGSRNLYLRGSAGYFIYNNLPSAVAQSSRLLGNEINKVSEAQYAFVNKYEGLEAFIETRFPVIKALDFVLGAEYLINQKAAADVNSGYRIYSSGEFHVTGNLDVVVEGNYFSIAPEAAVSYFNAAGFETNRQGYSVETYLSFKKEGFDVGAKYTEAEVMFTNAIQSREKTIMIKLETFYADI